MITVPFVPIDYPREVLELSSTGEKGWRRMVKNAEELESYWRGKNGSGNVYFTAYGYTATQVDLCGLIRVCLVPDTWLP